MKIISTCSLSITLSLSLLACGGKSSGGAAAPAAANTCATVATNQRALYLAGDPDEAEADRRSAAWATACAEDRWEVSAIDCFATATASMGTNCNQTLDMGDLGALGARLKPAEDTSCADYTAVLQACGDLVLGDFEGAATALANCEALAADVREGYRAKAALVDTSDEAACEAFLFPE